MAANLPTGARDAAHSNGELAQAAGAKRWRESFTGSVELLVVSKIKGRPQASGFGRRSRPTGAAKLVRSSPRRGTGVEDRGCGRGASCSRSGA